MRCCYFFFWSIFSELENGRFFYHNFTVYPIWQPALERSRDYIALSSAFLNANYLGGRRRSLFSNNDIVFDKVVIIFMDFCLVPHKKPVNLPKQVYLTMSYLQFRPKNEPPLMCWCFLIILFTFLIIYSHKTRAAR